MAYRSVAPESVFSELERFAAAFSIAPISQASRNGNALEVEIWVRPPATPLGSVSACRRWFFDQAEQAIATASELADVLDAEIEITKVPVECKVRLWMVLAEKERG